MLKDISIYEDVKSELFEMLLSSKHIIEKKILFIPPNYKGETGESIVYIVSEFFISELMVLRKRLLMEYPEDKKLQLEELVKIVNHNKPSHYYNIYQKDSHKSYTKPETVLEHLEKEKGIAKSRLKASINKNNKVKISELAKKKFREKINEEIDSLDERLEYIVENFDSLDVRISSYLTKSRGFAMNYKINKEKFHVRLSKEIPNIYWFEELEEDKVARIDNMQKEYFEKAINAFGDVYYLQKDSSES